MSNTAVVIEKLEKEQGKLKTLLAQKKALDKKIEKAQSNVAKYQGILDKEKFDKAKHVIDKSGVSFEDVMEAIASGDLTMLQMMMDEKKKNEEPLLSAGNVEEE